MTEQQLRALEFVREQLATIGVPPTIAEIAEKLDTSPSYATSAIDALVRMGKLTRQRGCTRSLQLAGVPDVRLIDTSTMRAELARRGVTLDALRVPEKLAYGRRAVSCAADCCNVQVKRGHLFCRAHWFDLPDALRAEIIATFRAGDTDAYQAAVTRARDLIDCGAPA